MAGAKNQAEKGAKEAAKAGKEAKGKAEAQMEEKTKLKANPKRTLGRITWELKVYFYFEKGVILTLSRHILCVMTLNFWLFNGQSLA